MPQHGDGQDDAGVLRSARRSERLRETRRPLQAFEHFDVRRVLRSARPPSARESRGGVAVVVLGLGHATDVEGVVGRTGVLRFSGELR